jgi:hypothetical protein
MSNAYNNLKEGLHLLRRKRDRHNLAYVYIKKPSYHKLGFWIFELSVAKLLDCNYSPEFITTWDVHDWWELTREKKQSNLAKNLYE